MMIVQTVLPNGVRRQRAFERVLGRSESGYPEYAFAVSVEGGWSLISWCYTESEAVADELDWKVKHRRLNQETAVLTAWDIADVEQGIK